MDELQTHASPQVSYLKTIVKVGSSAHVYSIVDILMCDTNKLALI